MQKSKQYRKKSELVTATRWLYHGDHPAVRPVGPHDDELLTGMGGATFVFDGRSSTSMSSTRSQYGVVGNTSSPKDLVGSGDYVIEHSDGKISVMRPTLFHLMYEDAFAETDKLLAERSAMLQRSLGISEGEY